MIFVRILLLLLTLVAPCLADVTTTDLPDIGASTGTIISPEYERRLGQAFLNQVRQQADINNDPEVESYIQSIGYRLVSHSDDNTQQFTFFVVNDPQINAFAAPGGIVGINSGVIVNSSSESELAAVMAHEISHVTQHHVLRQIEMQQHMSLPMMAAMLGAILVATQNPDAGEAAMAAVQGGMAQAQINFTRSNEAEADNIGMQLLERSGFDPNAMVTFFSKLLRDTRYFAQAPKFLQDHPVTQDRIADAEARASKYPHKAHYDESKMYEYIHAKLLVASFKDASQAEAYYKNALQKAEQVDPDGALRYGYALALIKANDIADARDLLKSLLDKDKENISFMLALANVEGLAGDYDAALKIYRHAQLLYPDYRPLVLEYSNALLISKHPDQALDILHKYAKDNEPDLTLYEYLTRAETEAGHPVESGIANAEYYYLSGETRVAIERLRYILRNQQPQPDYYQQERIRARLAYLEQELQIEKDMKLTR